jgi:Sugar kinases, ribokinase family
MKAMSLRTEGVLCIGELLWDVFPNGRHLGGAPPNVAVHLRSLGIASAVASRVGDDEAGAALRVRLAELGVPVHLIQSDRSPPTGVVTVDLSDHQAPRYTIEQPAAWDFIERTPELAAAAADLPSDCLRQPGAAKSDKPLDHPVHSAGRRAPRVRRQSPFALR